MGATPQGKDITIEFECQFRVDSPHGNVKVIIEDALYKSTAVYVP